MNDDACSLLPDVPPRITFTQKVEAIFNFCGQSNEDLTFQKGDIITVIAKKSSDWWIGELNGPVGLFPRNFVQEITDKPIVQTSNNPVVVVVVEEEKNNDQFSIVVSQEERSTSSELTGNEEEKYSFKLPKKWGLEKEEQIKFIEKHRSEYSVSDFCKILNISKKTFYEREKKLRK